MASGNTLTLNPQVNAGAYFPDQFATASSTVEEDLLSEGPLRDGIATATISCGFGDSGETGNGVLPGFPYTPDFICGGGDGLPFTMGFTADLGTAVSFDGTATWYIPVDPIYGGGGGFTFISETIQFFESDGVTPVQIALAEPAPEPATLSLLVLTLPLFWKWKKPQ